MQNRSLSAQLLWLLPIAFLLLFFFYPLSSILGLSLEYSQGGLGSVFAEALGNPRIRSVIAFTFWQAFLSLLLTLAVGLPAAWIFARFEFPGKKYLRALSAVPFVLPTLVVAAAFSAILGPRGWINLWLMDWLALDSPPIVFMNTFAAILVAHVFYNTTIVLRMLGDFWSRIDQRIEQAAKTLGASSWQVFRQITLPLLMPAILAASLLVFLFDFTSFGVVLILGGPGFSTLEVEIYTQATAFFNLPLAAVLSIIQIGITLTLSLVYSRLSAKLSRPIRLSNSRGSSKPLKNLRSRAWISAYLLLLGLFFITPLLGLSARSLTTLGTDRQQNDLSRTQFTVSHYQSLFEQRDDLFFAQPSRALQVSFIYGAATVLLTMLIGLPAAWGLAKRGSTWIARVIDPLLMLPIGTSAVTLGLGFIVALDQPPLDLRASPLLVPLAHSLVALPFVVRSLTPALKSIRPEIRQAAAVLGANPSQILRNVDLPLVGKAVLVAASFAFSISLGEFGATALIARPEFPTIPTMIFRLLGQPGAAHYGQAMALSTILMLASAGAVLSIEGLRIAEVGEF
jgi:thiamine transport system permease protein